MKDEEKPGEPHRPVYGALGPGLLAAGVVIFLLIMMESLGGLPFDMPRSWYVNRGLWVGIGVACLIAGVLIQRPPKGDERDTT